MRRGRVRINEVRIRPHHLLCIQGFRGQGYSPGFIANMARLIDRLKTERGLRVRIVSGPDDICGACPHLSGGACACPDQGDVNEFDARTLRQLGLKAGETPTWAALMKAVAARISAAYIRRYCGGCRWMEFDFCTGAFTEPGAAGSGRAPGAGAIQEGA